MKNQLSFSFKFDNLGCTGYVFTWNNGSWVSRNIWNCSNFEECGAKPHFGFGTFIIAREKDALSPVCRNKIITKFVYANNCIDCTSETSTSTNEGMELTLTNDAPTSAATEATIIPEPTTTAEITINTELITTMKKRKQLLEGGAAVIILKNKTKFDKMNAVADALKPALFTSEGCIIYVIAICLLLFF